MDISVIIVSYNTADLIGKCLSSLQTSCSGEMEIIVVDNASEDGSAEVVAGQFPAVHLVRNSTNRGFAAANNLALSRCRGRYIFFLNPDTEATPGSLDRSLVYMDAHPEAGLAGLRIVNPDGSLQESISYHYPGQRHSGAELKGLKGNIACVLGAAMIARREAVETVGGFDEDFFLYGEDEDLCLRLRKAGYEIGYIDEATIVHLGGQSERKSIPAEVWRKKSRAEQLFYKKHYLPTTIRKICRADLIKSYYRIITLNMRLPFLNGSLRRAEKQQKYRIRCQEMRSLYRDIRKGIC